ncbi:MAG TPA: cystathionine gamma-lyase [Candidatus Baltobacteraceae bacterium]|nr:cystathionine gamma-lyase [Candidatus Baltobacteraceae bacterium]
MNERPWSDATRVVHAGKRRPAPGEALLGGPVFASHFAAPESADAPFAYGREDNPTFRAYEAALGDLEGGDAVVFASGMAAIEAVFGSVLLPGDVLVVPAGGYYSTRGLADAYATRHGVRVRRIEPADASNPATYAGAKLAWIETPLNPQLEVVDVAEAARLAHDAGALLAVDDTTATPLATRPLELGADFSVSSDSKMMTGHGDLILGHVAATSAERVAALGEWRRLHGAVPGPMEVFLAHRSLATLHVRLERCSANALRIAEALAARANARGDVRDVRYPGLATAPQHALAARQMRFFGSVLCFDAGSRERAVRFLSELRLVVEATSFGSVHTTAERRARWGGDDVTGGFIRLSAGCEAAVDVIADLTRALDATLP